MPSAMARFRLIPALLTAVVLIVLVVVGLWIQFGFWPGSARDDSRRISRDVRMSRQIARLHGLSDCPAWLRDHVRQQWARVPERAAMNPRALVLIDRALESETLLLAFTGQGVQRFSLTRPTVLSSNDTSPPAQPASELSGAARSSAVGDSVLVALRRHVRYTRGDLELGSDGTSYVIQIPGERCGTTWSPSPDSLAGKLVEVIDRTGNGSASEAEVVAALADLEAFELDVLPALDQDAADD